MAGPLSATAAVALAGIIACLFLVVVWLSVTVAYVGFLAKSRNNNDNNSAQRSVPPLRDTAPSSTSTTTATTATTVTTGKSKSWWLDALADFLLGPMKAASAAGGGPPRQDTTIVTTISSHGAVRARESEIRRSLVLDPRPGPAGLLTAGASPGHPEEIKLTAAASRFPVEPGPVQPGDAAAATAAAAATLAALVARPPPPLDSGMVLPPMLAGTAAPRDVSGVQPYQDPSALARTTASAANANANASNVDNPGGMGMGMGMPLSLISSISSQLPTLPMYNVTAAGPPPATLQSSSPWAAASRPWDDGQAGAPLYGHGSSSMKPVYY